MPDKIFDLQTIKDNLGLLTKEILDEINQIVAKLGHEELTEKQRGKLKTKADSIVYIFRFQYKEELHLNGEERFTNCTLSPKPNGGYDTHFSTGF